MANEAVTKYLVETNRPYSCIDITTNLRGAYSKTIIQRTLDSLSETGKIRCKVYGKQKVYCAIQPDDGNNDEGSTQEDVEARIKALTTRLAEKTAAMKEAEATLKNLLTKPTNEEAKLQIEKLKTSTAEMEQKLNGLKSSTDLISEEDRSAILNEHGSFMKEYRKRKRLCTDIMDAILEGYPKSKKCFVEELCLETDEEVGFQIKSQLNT